MKKKITIIDTKGKVHEEEFKVRDLNVLQARQTFRSQVFKNKKAYTRKEKYRRVEEY